MEIRSRDDYNRRFIGERLAEARRAKGWSILEMANCAQGVTAAQLGEIEQGRRVCGEHVLRELAAQYERPLRYFVPTP